MNDLPELADIHRRQIAEARQRGWAGLCWICQTSPDMGKWGGHRARLFGIPPGRDAGRELVPDFFSEVVPALDRTYPNP
jgi:hypothetical protein